MTENERIIVLVDMDCFYVQVEQRRDPTIRGKPCAVVQYNKWKGGGIIAVSYEARAKGISRNMRGDAAKEKCPNITLCMVPTANGKADLTRYRDAGAEVIQVLLQFGGTVERASIDEAYIDLTSLIDKRLKSGTNFSDCLSAMDQLAHTYAIGYPVEEGTIDGRATLERRLSGLSEFMKYSNGSINAVRLLMAAALVEEMRLAIYEQTSFRCSAGISHNKVLAKLVCGINKPNKQTILSINQIGYLFKNIKLGKIRNLGGKLGQQVIDKYGFEYIGQLTSFSEEKLIQDFGSKTGHWLYEICRGIDHEPVKERHVAQSVGCSKTFRANEVLNTRTKVKHWITCLVTELVERLTQDKEVNNRVSKGLTAYIGLQGRKPVSRSCQINEYSIEHISRVVLETLEQLNQCNDRSSDSWYPGINLVGISAGKFKDNQGSSQSIGKFLPEKKNMSVVKFMTSPKKQACASNSETGKSMTGHQRKEIALPGKKKMSLDAFISPQTSRAKYDDSKERTFDFKEESRQTDKNERSLIIKTDGKVEEKRKHVQNIIKPACKNSTSQPTKDKLPSFFSRMNEIRNQTRTTKIEAAYDMLSNQQSKGNPDSSEPSEVNQKQLVGISTDVQSSNCLLITESTDVDSDTKSSNQLRKNIIYDMEQVDMDVFRSLPLNIQQEIRFSNRTLFPSSPSSCGAPAQKRQKVTLSNSQKSISGFLSKVEPSFELSKQSSPSRKKSPKPNLLRNRNKVVYNSDFAEKNNSEVPLGFFRARTQASAAIRNAVEMHAIGSQKRRLEATQVSKTNNENSSVTVKDSVMLSCTRNVRNSNTENTLWSSITNEESA